MSGSLKWAYDIRTILSTEKREIFDRFLARRGNIFGGTEAAVIKELQFDTSGLKHKALAEVVEHFDAVGWPSRLGTKTVNLKLKEVQKRLTREALPKEQHGHFTPAYFVAYRHRKPGHT